jgi:hypothetical protein
MLGKSCGGDAPSRARYENSGVETAKGIIDLLMNRLGPQPPPQSPSVELRLMIISGTNAIDYPFGRFERIRMNELGSPIIALLNSRVERAERAISSVQGASFPQSIRAGIPFTYFKPPLGWHVSQFTLSRLNAYMGTAERCTRMGIEGHDADDPFYDFLSLMSNLRRDLLDNHCSACSMIQAAQGLPPKSPFEVISCASKEK